MESFRFKRFEVSNEASALKVGTDAVLLGCAATIPDAAEDILDIGTGTGVIALILAQRLSGKREDAFRITGIDIDGPSAVEAGMNFSRSPWSDNLRSIHTPLSEFHPDRGFDLIVSNPPYFESSLENPDRREAAARHTSSLSTSDIFAFSAEKLNPGGILSIILPSDLEGRILRSAASFGLFPKRILRIKTTERKTEKRLIIDFSFSKGPLSTEYLTLMSGNEKSREYSRLTEDFYL